MWVQPCQFSACSEAEEAPVWGGGEFRLPHQRPSTLSSPETF